MPHHGQRSKSCCFVSPRRKSFCADDDLCARGFWCTIPSEKLTAISRLLLVQAAKFAHHPRVTHVTPQPPPLEPKGAPLMVLVEDDGIPAGKCTLAKKRRTGEDPEPSEPEGSAAHSNREPYSHTHRQCFAFCHYTARPPSLERTDKLLSCTGFASSSRNHPPGQANNPTLVWK